MKAAIVVLADTETHEALGRAVNAMTALDFKQAGDDVQLIFDGGATRWPPALIDKDHQAHNLYETPPQLPHAHGRRLPDPDLLGCVR